MIDSLKTKIESGKYKPRSIPKGVVIEKKAKQIQLFDLESLDVINIDINAMDTGT